MATYTKNLNLKKPTDSENFDIQDFNGNADILEQEISKRLIKNEKITAQTKPKITYDENGLVLGGEDLIPEDIPNLHISKIEGRPPIVYVNDVPIYGSRFFDTDEIGNIVLREDGSGEYLLTVLENGEILLRKVVTQIDDNLESDNPKAALSAKQGKILNGRIEGLSENLSNADDDINEITSDLEAHKSDKNNPHSVTKTQVGLGNVDNTSDADKPISTAAETRLSALDSVIDAHTGNKSNPHNVTKAQVGLGNADNTADSAKKVLSATKLTTARKINGVSFDGSKDITITDETRIPATQKGAAGGVAELDENGFVPSSQLPSYVDDVIEGYFYNNKFYKEASHTTEITGETGKIYTDVATNLTYRWSGTKFVEISQSLALGETSSTAYAGKKGKQNAENISALTERMTEVENDVENLQNEKAEKTDVENALAEKADLSKGKIPYEQLPGDVVTINGITLYPTTFVDVDDNGEVFLREDGSGDYLLYVTILGVPMLRYMGNAITDDVTGVSYSFIISNGAAVLKEII